MLQLDCAQEFEASCDEEFFASLPSRPGVLLIEMADTGAQPYLARTADIRRSCERLLRVPEALSKRLNLRAVAARVRYRVTGSKFEQTFTHYLQARSHFPQRYRDLVRLRPPAVLKVNLCNEYPRCYVTRRIASDDAFYFGPFQSRRIADAFLEGFLDLFKIRRCQIKIRRDPKFPGCIYSEMKMCLAPCFAGCTTQEYNAEVTRVLETLATSGEALITQVTRERDAASEALDFERAAALHKRLEKVSGVLRGLPDIARRIDKLNVVILQRGADEKTILAFPFLQGVLAEPIFLRFEELSSDPRSVEAILRTGLSGCVGNAKALVQDVPNLTTATAVKSADRPETAPESVADYCAKYGQRSVHPEMPEHLSLLARWFYSNPREGEIFFKDADWPYRRILRACARLLAPPETPQAPSNSPSQTIL